MLSDNEKENGVGYQGQNGLEKEIVLSRFENTG